MYFADLLLRAETRRHFFGRCGVGLGSIALGSLLAGPADARAAAAAGPESLPGPGAPGRNLRRGGDGVSTNCAAAPATLPRSSASCDPESACAPTRPCVSA